MLILKLLSEEDLYGYEMATLLNTISNHEITFNAGNMYPALYRLEEKGFITKRKEKVGKRVEFIYYHITDSGLSELQAMYEDYQKFISIVQDIFTYKKGEKEKYISWKKMIPVQCTIRSWKGFFQNCNLPRENF